MSIKKKKTLARDTIGGRCNDELGYLAFLIQSTHSAYINVIYLMESKTMHVFKWASLEWSPHCAAQRMNYFV